MFHRFPAYFDPFTSIWEILIKMKIDMKNVDFTRFSYKYLICGFNPEISTWKLIFQKVQMIFYILPIYHFFISCILNELCSSENTCEIIRFGDKCFKIFTSELTKYTVGPKWAGRLLGFALKQFPRFFFEKSWRYSNMRGVQILAQKRF